jgi:hypothetical protein
MDARKASIFDILTHNLIKSHIRDGSRHLDCCRASFYNDASLCMGVRRSFKEREVDSEPLAPRGRSEEYTSLTKAEADCTRTFIPPIFPFDTDVDSKSRG